MALTCLIKLLLLAATVALAYGGGSKHCRQRSSSAVDNCPGAVNKLIVPMYADKGVDNTNVKIQYQSGFVVNCGNRPTQSQVFYPPRVTYSPFFIPCAYLTIIVIDVSLPAGKVPFLHYMVVNIRAQDIRNGQLGNAVTTVSHLQPYIDEDKHVYLIYCQKDKLIPAKVKELQKYQDNRYKFPVKKVAKDYGFGNPIVGQYLVMNSVGPRRSKS